MRSVLTFVILAVFSSGECSVWASGSPDVVVHSPDGRNEIRCWTDTLAYEVARDGVVVADKAEIGMTVGGRCLETGETRQVSQAKMSGLVEMPIYKKSRIDLAGNGAFIDFGAWGGSACGKRRRRCLPF